MFILTANKQGRYMYDNPNKILINTNELQIIILYIKKNLYTKIYRSMI